MQSRRLRSCMPANQFQKIVGSICSIMLVIGTLLLSSGCTVLSLKRIQPKISPVSGTTCDPASRRFLVSEAQAIDFHYVYSPSAAFRINPSTRQAKATTFEDYRSSLKGVLTTKLPPGLAQHKVTTALTDFLIAIAGASQLEAQIANGTLNPSNAAQKTLINAERASIQKYAKAPNLKYSEMKDFANKLFDLELRHGAADLTQNPFATNAAIFGVESGSDPKAKIDDGLLKYLKAYYDGQFYDRMGTAIAKPQFSTDSGNTTIPISFTIPDSEIVAAETVLLEFAIDLFDPTPVMGNKPKAADVTLFYPGGTKNEPTALTLGAAEYIELPETGCGITQQNVWILKDIANAASDQAAAVGGLIVNTPGGISIGLGVLGKISVGDNQTLSDLVKTAASEVAFRGSLAASYALLRNVDFTPIIPPQP